MKTIKNTQAKKISTKTADPKFIVDLTDVYDSNTALVRFGIAKHKAGIPMLDEELNAIIDKSIDITLKTMAKSISKASKTVEINGDEKLIFDSKGNFKVKKPGMMKRFWNWVTRKKQ